MSHCAQCNHKLLRAQAKATGGANKHQHHHTCLRGVIEAYLLCQQRLEQLLPDSNIQPPHRNAEQATTKAGEGATQHCNTNKLQRCHAELVPVCVLSCGVAWLSAIVWWRSVRVWSKDAVQVAAVISSQQYKSKRTPISSTHASRLDATPTTNNPY